jgi:hypothetical protein
MQEAGLTSGWSGPQQIAVLNRGPLAGPELARVTRSKISESIGVENVAPSVPALVSD